MQRIQRRLAARRVTARAPAPVTQKGPRWCPGAFGPASRILYRATGECVPSCWISAPASACSSVRCACSVWISHSAWSASTASNEASNEAPNASSCPPVAPNEAPSWCRSRHEAPNEVRPGSEPLCPAFQFSRAPGLPGRRCRTPVWRPGRSAEAGSSRLRCPAACGPATAGSRPSWSHAATHRSARERARSPRGEPGPWHPPGRLW